tara:strand:+ start:2426 stop:3505 length:1080 start_codon:yes stop_codon:yes gene_type:complete
MIRVLFIYFLFISALISFGQDQNAKISVDKGQKIILIGETHFVKEKYSEIKTIVFKHLDSLAIGETASIFFELPFSLNYVFNKMRTEGDTSLFLDWFNHLYQKKGQPPSYFWTDYRDLFLDLIRYADKKDVRLNLKGIDKELEYRRTAYILSLFQSKLDTRIDSFLNVEYMRNDSTERKFLIDYVNESMHYTNNIIELEILEKLSHSLLIECTVCSERDLFIKNNFFNHYSQNDKLVIGTFGLDHIIESHDFSQASEYFKMKYLIDTSGYESFYTLIKEEINQPITRLGIISLKQGMKYYDIERPNDYDHIMLNKERLFIEALMSDKEVIRIYPSHYNELKNLSSHLDYLIIYESSHFR